MNIRIKRKVVKKSFSKVFLIVIFIFASCAACFISSYNSQFSEVMAVKNSNEVISYAESINVQSGLEQTTNQAIQKEIQIEENFEEEKVIKAIDKYLGGLLKGYGKYFYKSGIKNHANPMMLAAISIHETDNGNPWQYPRKGVKLPSVLIKLNNVCGMNRRTGFKYEGRYTKYDSIEQSIEDMAYWTKHYYIDTLKLTSITDIASVYAPLNDYQNNTMGMSNESWPGSVTEKYKKILNDAK